MRSVVAISAILALLPAACSPGAASTTSPSTTPTSTVAQPTPSPTPSVSATAVSLRYVALGDSYTIGTSVGESERWPNQLVERLSGPAQVDLVANLGVNGYTSQDLIDDELPQLAGLKPEFVTLLIGVNDVVQGVPEAAYSSNVDYILDELIAAVGESHVVVVSVPDYTLTPRGSSFGDPEQQRAEIQRFNEVMATRCSALGIEFVSIDEVANRVPTDRSLVARDGLHPSGTQYAGWVDLIAPVVMAAIGSGADR